ncbi:tyrosine-type recombinase/integrase [Flintibacter muris]|uniref:tyrosine-type recombinase/integrase n=1 Tax=Flintibacter muris TaxID=2941327 RepID=UPI00203C0B3C|nr:site-specific integrase [Flintibacter muris]
MAKRRPSGDGMVRKRDDGRWEGRIVVGHKENGDSIFHYVYAPTQKELSVKLRQEINAYQGVDLTEDSSMTLGDWLDRWLDGYMAGTVRPSTLQAYRRYADLYIKPTLGDRPLNQITPAEIQKLYAHLKKRGRVRKHEKYGQQLSDSMVHCIHTLLHGAMGAAEQFRLIPRNPVAEVTVPKRKLPPKQILNVEQLDTFMAAIQADDIWHDFFYTELTTGLRLGEICGLRWEDFDAEHGVLNIQRTVHVEKGGVLTTGDTKTYAGTRKIVLPASTVQCLRERKEAALTDWIFPNPLKPELPVNPRAAYSRLKVLLKDTDLPSIRFHDLRHPNVKPKTKNFYSFLSHLCVQRVTLSPITF